MLLNFNHSLIQRYIARIAFYKKNIRLARELRVEDTGKEVLNKESRMRCKIEDKDSLHGIEHWNTCHLMWAWGCMSAGQNLERRRQKT